MAAALVDGEIVDGDLSILDGVVDQVGLTPAGRGTAVPGLVDLQVNGFGGVEFRHTDPAGYETASMALAAHGATAVQPTFFSCTIDDYCDALSVVSEVRSGSLGGARMLPAHLEGPFLSPEWAGAHDPAHFVDPDPEIVDRLLGSGPVGFMTVAPELSGGLDLVRRLVAGGVVVSIGHSGADGGEVRDAIAAGARHITHCWNAHRRFTSRDPGPAGVALIDPSLTVGLIADLVHVSAEAVALTVASCRGRLAATTDAITPAGTATDLDAGRLADGTLAGSVATPDDLLRNLVTCGADLAAAVDACGGAQRRLMGLPDVRLRPGDVADVAVFDDALSPVRTLVAGREVWRSGP